MPPVRQPVCAFREVWRDFDTVNLSPEPHVKLLVTAGFVAQVIVIFIPSSREEEAARRSLVVLVWAVRVVCVRWWSCVQLQRSVRSWVVKTVEVGFEGPCPLFAFREERGKVKQQLYSSSNDGMDPYGESLYRFPSRLACRISVPDPARR